jgi:hypothetical protein
MSSGRNSRFTSDLPPPISYFRMVLVSRINSRPRPNRDSEWESDPRPADPRRAPAAPEALRLIANETVLRILIETAAGNNDWVLATLGRLPPAIVGTGYHPKTLCTSWAPCFFSAKAQTGWHPKTA